MKYLLNLIFILCLVQPATLARGEQPRGERKWWVIESRSSLSINGSSNISDFVCDIKEYLRPDTICLVRNARNDGFQFFNSSLSVEVKKFDCHSRFITGDFRKTLQADDYPFLKIRFLTIGNLVETGNKQLLRGILEIELANRIKRIDIEYLVTPLAGNRISIQGHKLLKFSDFNLKPPSKLAGMVRIEEDIKVNFQLFFRILPSTLTP